MLFDLSRFKRITSSGRFIPQIDGLRFLAISSVFLYHVHGYLTVGAGYAEDGWWTRQLTTGHFGVQLFFGISGFILALPFASHHLRGAKRVSLRGYFLRRL